MSCPNKIPSWIRKRTRNAKTRAFLEAMKNCVEDPSCQPSLLDVQFGEQKHSTERTLRIVTLNLHGLLTIDKVDACERLKRDILLMCPDICVFQEVPGKRKNAVKFLKILQELGFCYPDPIRCFNGGQRFGNTIVSKLPSKYLKIPSKLQNTSKGEFVILECSISRMHSKQDVQLVVACVHLSVNGSDATRIHEFKSLHKFLMDKEVRNCVVLGDFNSLSRTLYTFDEEMIRVKAEIDRDDKLRGQKMPSENVSTVLGYLEECIGYKHAHELGSCSPPVFTHWSGKVIDHILISPNFSQIDPLKPETLPDFRVLNVEVCHTDCSDHLPVFVDLEITSFTTE